MTPRPDVSAARKAQILQAACAVFARDGFQAARMDDIVREANLSKGGVYWYFKSKDAIIQTLMADLFDRDLDEAAALLKAPGSASDRIMTLVQTIAAEFTALRDVMVVGYEYYALAMRDDTARDLLRDYFTRYHTLLKALVEQGQASGEFHVPDVPGAALSLMSALEGTGLLWVMDPTVFDFTAQVELTVRMLLAGFDRGVASDGRSA